MVANLVQPEQLVLGQSVIQLGAAAPQQERTPPPLWQETSRRNASAIKNSPTTMLVKPPTWKKPSETRPVVFVDLS